ncbi:phosphatase PAP2 family protein [Streptomyces sp. NPDC020965]|uniref:phosphatase PAP2 family protein n=1 Tax=Streptomyces sp. NPDC020965 TaxID=3365105 RepID=UPI0037A7438F
MVLFALITWQVAADGPARSVDERIERAIVGLGPEPLTEFLADLGNLAVALPVLTAALAYALWRDRTARRRSGGHEDGGRADGGSPRTGGTRRRRYEALGIVLVMVALPAFVVPLKALIDRPGPLADGSGIGGTGGYYPSGHAATAMVAYCGAALLLAPYQRRRWAMPAAWVLTLATGIGLVLRGYHWPLDVLGSWCLCGALLLISSISSIRSISSISSRDRRRSSGRTRTGCTGPS